MAIILSEHFNKLEMSGSTQWYEVKVNVESDNLNDIDQVEYYLDRSVSPSVMVSENPNDKFEVQIRSWKSKEEFPLSAKITFKDPNTPPLILAGE